jgi:predicted flap endonuclease-1-like 5' DNA nuclease
MKWWIWLLLILVLLSLIVLIVLLLDRKKRGSRRRMAMPRTDRPAEPAVQPPALAEEAVAEAETGGAAEEAWAEVKEAAEETEAKVEKAVAGAGAEVEEAVEEVEAQVEETAQETAAQIASRAPQAAVVEQPVDDLKVIEGIGPKISGILQAAGIATFGQLAATDVGALKQILAEANIRLGDPTTWPEQAALAAENKWDELTALQDSLKGGRRA